jgi:UDP-N-acetylglucosamine--N-acetylmuramyl-(pentapeptide) pyrophosphoryl-undecaprenol N-acetylglucosamine transferase
VTGHSLSVVIAGGGTGGHLYPGLAVARALLARRPEARVSFAGTARGLEARVVPQEGFDLDLIRSVGIKGKSVTARLRGGATLPLSLLDAWRVVARRNPCVVVGVGGYSSGPIVLIAAMRGVPTMVLEQNAVPGLTNRWLAPFVRAAAVTYDGTLSYFRGRGFVAGNPVRPEFLQSRSAGEAARASHPPRVLILGGSQGAHAINVAMVAAAPELVRRCPEMHILHQTGARDLEMVRRAYQDAGIPARAESFLDGVAGEMTRADVVVSRAGATTLAELAALGVPAVLVPFPSAADDHQRKNAEVLARAGAAILIEERTLATDEGRAVLTSAILSIAGEPETGAAMRAQMGTFAKPDAADMIVDRLLELAA